MDPVEFDAAILYVLCGDWRDGIRFSTQIPSALYRGLVAENVEFARLFPLLEETQDPFPDYVEQSFSTGRYLYHMDKDDGDSDISPIRETEEEESVSSNLDSCLVGVDSLTMIHSTERVLVGSKTSSIHPYTLSAACFCLAVVLKNEFEQERIVLPTSTANQMLMKPERFAEKSIYLDLRRRFEGVETPSIESKTLDQVAEQLCRACIDTKDDTDAAKLVRKLANVYSAISKHKVDKKQFCSQRGTLVVPDMILKDPTLFYSNSSFCKEFKDTFTGREAFAVHADNSSVLRFERGNVTATSIYTTLKLLSLRFKKALLDKARIAFDDLYTYLIIEKHALRVIQMVYIPFLCTTPLLISRNLNDTKPSPIYPLHIRNYFALSDGMNDKERLLLAMKSLVKTFDRTRNTIDSWPDVDDPIVELYDLFAPIVDRFGSKEEIWKICVDPFNEYDKLWYGTKGSGKKRKAIGFKEDGRTIYSAIKSFCYVYSKHNIRSDVVRDLLYLFEVQKMHLQEKFPLQYQLLRIVQETADEKDAEIIEIPEHVFLLEEFPFPTHVCLYYLCASQEIPDELAIQLFIGLSSKTRKLEGSITFSSPQSTRSPSESLKYSLIDFVRNQRNKNEKEEFKADIPHVGLTYLFCTLEQLSYYGTTIQQKKRKISEKDSIYRGEAEPIRDLLPMRENEILDDTFKVAVQSTKGILYSNSQVFPIWNSELYDIKEEDGFAMLGTRASSRFRRGTLKTASGNEHDLLPFAGCHEDFLDCILLYPCCSISQDLVCSVLQKRDPDKVKKEK